MRAEGPFAATAAGMPPHPPSPSKPLESGAIWKQRLPFLCTTQLTGSCGLDGGGASLNAANWRVQLVRCGLNPCDSTNNPTGAGGLRAWVTGNAASAPFVVKGRSRASPTWEPDLGACRAANSRPSPRAVSAGYQASYPACANASDPSPQAPSCTLAPIADATRVSTPYPGYLTNVSDQAGGAAFPDEPRAPSVRDGSTSHPTPPHPPLTDGPSPPPCSTSSTFQTRTWGVRCAAPAGRLRLTLANLPMP